MKQTTLDALRELIVKFREERDWEQFHNPKDMAIGITLEAAELLEMVHWKQGAELKEHLAKKRVEFSDELADILGWLLLLANDYDINLAAAFREKMKKNAAKYPVEKSKGSARKYTEL